MARSETRSVNQATGYFKVEPAANLMAIAYEAFKKDLPSMLKTDFGKVVAYQGSDRLYICATMDDLYTTIRNAKKDFKSLLIQRIEPERTEIKLNWNW